MTFYIPYTFTGGQSAKAQEVNANFQQVKKFVENLEDTQEEIQQAVSGMETDKANLNGSSQEVFNVADPTNSTHAVSKAFLDNQLLPFRYMIVGLNLIKAGNQTLTVSVGGCYDSNYTNPIANNTNVSLVTTDITSASTTYNIYILARVSSPTATSLVLTVGGNEPVLVETDTIYRKIGTLTTDALNNIDTLTKESV